MEVMNSFWYVLLIIMFLILFIFTLWKIRNPKLIVLYFFVAGLIYIFEYIILVLFKSYEYDPDILKIRYFDDIMGSFVSSGISVPMTAVFIAGFQLNYFWILAFMTFFLGIEILFSELGIYQHYWWNIFHTGIGVIVIFSIAKHWIHVISKKPLKKNIRFLILYFVNLTNQATLVFFAVAFFHMYFYALDWFADPARSHIAFATLYIVMFSFLFAGLVTFRLSWIWVGAVIVIMSVSDVILLQMNILQLSNNWVLSYFFISRLFLYAVLRVINHIIDLKD